MHTVETTLQELKKLVSAAQDDAPYHFGITASKSLGAIKTPDLRKLAKQIGRNQPLAQQLWNTGIHEAKHIAIFIADPKAFSEKLMEQWLKDFDSWDIVDNCCGTLFDKTPFAYEKAIEWTKRKKEFEKRAGFAMMATLAIHDKKSEDKKFEQFFPRIIAESHDERNFVKKAINWALRQIGKRNGRLCTKAITAAKQIQRKGDASSRWIAGDAIRELENYQKAGRIRSIGI